MSPTQTTQLSFLDHPSSPESLAVFSSNERSRCLMEAASDFLAVLCEGKALEASLLRQAMSRAFGGSDAEGLWCWKDVYEAQEIAAVLFVRKYTEALSRRSPVSVMVALEKLQSLMATQTRRSDTSQQWQQFSTPLPLAFAVSQAAGLVATDVVLEPSAGTGLLALFAERTIARLMLNELEPQRRDLLQALFPDVCVTALAGEHVDDLLPRDQVPSVVLMNPPFSTSPTMVGSNPSVTGRHVFSALSRLASGGRLVAITGRNFAPEKSAWRAAFSRLQADARVVFSAPLAGSLYYKHGTGFETRLTVIDKTPALDPHDFSGYVPDLVEDTAHLLDLIESRVPARPLVPLPDTRPAKLAVTQLVQKPLGASSCKPVLPEPTPLPSRTTQWSCRSAPIDVSRGTDVVYETFLDGAGPDGEACEGLYEDYRPQSVIIAGAQDHPSPLVQSAAMSSVAPPQPSYVPVLPERLISEGVLSAAQIESIIYAGEAHERILPGEHVMNKHHDVALPGETASDDETLRTVQFRQGWFLGDGTGCGKGRQIAGIILDNRLKGRVRAVWISKNDKLLEDARRDWAAVGGDPLMVTPLSRFKQGQPITITDGILFMTYGTLRSGARGGKKSRLDQVVDWLGEDFDGPLMFDESHALANATAGEANGDSGGRTRAASKQGQAGLRLQRALPLARVCYVSATGATQVENLAYAERLGLWGDGTAFLNRTAFVSAMEAGGVAAMEVISRDLKAMGLYTARSLSYEGVEVEILEHALRPEQIEIYDAFARAYHIIHQNLQAALESSNISSGGKTLNKDAKSAALSAFESGKQRFFSHLLTAMKCPSLIKSIKADIERGDAVIIQLVSTGEALLNRRLAHIPSSEWNDLSIDVTPKDATIDYLMNSFPVQLFEPYINKDGEPGSRPMVDADGNPVINRAAEARRDAMVEHLAGLPAVPTALDQIVHHFGTDQVAEVTGRSIRLVRGEDGVVSVEKRPASSNLAESRAYMDDEKRILIFSDAGGTGRSYHADRDAKNSRRRVHYLLEPGWRADTAIQGLGRSNRTNQASAPLFRPVATNVKGEKRFLSTIARRLDTLGAITKGQRQTGGQGMFRAEDNLESLYARAALRQLYRQICRGKVADCSLRDFEDQTGLSLLDADGSVREDMPPMSRFLNRVLALTIARQNALFEAFEDIFEQILEGARTSGGLDVGLETLKADSFTLVASRDVFEHEQTRATTRCLKTERRDRVEAQSFEDAILRHAAAAVLMINARSGRVALSVPAPGSMSETGAVQTRRRLVRPTGTTSMSEADLAESNWEVVSLEQFRQVWASEVAALPEFQTGEFYLVVGLLLPIWDRMGDSGSLRINRLQTDDGQRLLGRVIDEDDLPAFYTALGLDAPVVSTDGLWRSVLEKGASHALSGSAWHMHERALRGLERRGLRLRRSLVMGEHRAEISDVTGDDMFDALIALGCTTEIIQYSRRVFIPTDERGPEILERVLERFPLVQCHPSEPPCGSRGG